MADAKTAKKVTKGKPVEVESNHNSMTPPKPVGVAFLAERPDYNPLRRMPNKANLASDTTNVPETAEELVEAKGDRPYRAVVEANAETVADTSAAPDKVKERAKEVSAEAGAVPNVYADRLPSDVTAANVPATDSGSPGVHNATAATNGGQPADNA